MTMERKFTSLRELEAIYANNKLTDYLTTLSTEELSDIKRLILCDDIVGVRISLLSAVEDAIEYRFLEQYISLKDAEFLSGEFDLQLTPANYLEMKESFELLDRRTDFLSLVRWCPSLLYLNKTYKVYSFLKESGKTDQEIVSLLCSSFDRVMKLSETLDDARYNHNFAVEFNHLLDGIARTVEQNKANTESYRKYTNQMFKQNADLLKRLS